MQPNSDELNELARRLASYSPATAGLDADAMLFAAGQATVHRGSAQIAWWGLTVCLTALVALLGGFWFVQRVWF